MPEKDRELRAAHEVAVAALAGGKNIKETAELAGVNEKTLYRWRSNPKFQARVTAARKALFDATIGGYAKAGQLAIVTLAELLVVEDAKVRLDAAKAILDGLKYREIPTPSQTSPVEPEAEIFTTVLPDGTVKTETTKHDPNNFLRHRIHSYREELSRVVEREQKELATRQDVDAGSDDLQEPVHPSHPPSPIAAPD